MTNYRINIENVGGFTNNRHRTQLRRNRIQQYSRVDDSSSSSIGQSISSFGINVSSSQDSQSYHLPCYHYPYHKPQGYHPSIQLSTILLTPDTLSLSTTNGSSKLTTL